MLELHNNYHVKPESGCRKQVDKDNLKRLFYRSETNFSFEKYVKI